MSSNVSASMSTVRLLFSGMTSDRALNTLNTLSKKKGPNFMS